MAAAAPASAASQCRSPRCTAERRGVRRELDSWRHRLMHCVGFESILEGLYGPRLRRDLSLFEDCEPEEVTDWSMDEKCSFCNLHKEAVGDHTAVIGSLQSTPTEELSSQGQSNTDKIECQAENYLNALFRKKGFKLREKTITDFAEAVCESLSLHPESWCETGHELAEALEDMDAVFTDAVIIPPEVDILTDEEDLDDSHILLNDPEASELPGDIAGTFELQSGNDPESELEEVATTSTSRPRHSKRKHSPKWRKMLPVFQSVPENCEAESVANLEERYGSLSPVDIAGLFINDTMLTLLVEFSVQYARERNDHVFSVTKTEMRKFIGILLLSGYCPLPQSRHYWSMDRDKGCPVVKETMPRNRFDEIKKYIHLSDNRFLDKSDKFSKIRPFLDALNRSFLQFGVFSYKVSIDEQMVPYFGRHSAKMFIRGKPVRFGFKLWCLASASGYLYQFIPYAGATDAPKDGLGLRETVVLKLLEVTATEPKQHEIYFDNFFSSYHLLSLLSERGFHAAGTVRDNRLMDCNALRNAKDMKQSPKGESDHAFDTNRSICVVRWRDNSVVTLISNFIGPEPKGNAKRYNRRTKTFQMVPQPHVIQQYSQGMGGVDSHDNAVAKYRISMRGKKWWWPLFINGLDSAIVNAWRICRLVSNPNISQMDFKSEVAMAFMQGEWKDEDDDEEEQRTATASRGTPPRESLSDSVRFDDRGHLVMRSERGRRRCRKCKSQTVYECKKCKVHVHPDCFVDFHTPQYSFL